MSAKFWFAACWIVSVLAVLCPTYATAEIFRTVDADGNVVFSDIPPSAGEASESVTVDPVNTFVAPEPVTTAPPAEVEVPEVAPYESLTILSPGNDETVRENAGNVTVSVALVPALRSGDRLVLYMDGNRSAVAAEGSSFRLENVDRGTHTVGVRVIDEAGKVAAEAATATFTVQRVSRPRISPT